MVQRRPLEDRLAGLEISSEPLRPASQIPELKGEDSDLVVTLIDFTLSRASFGTGHTVYDAFEDECIFQGEGETENLVLTYQCAIISDTILPLSRR